jgi:putative DNA primase/helicase
MSARKPVESFMDAMRDAGIAPTSSNAVTADGRFCRFHVQGDKAGSRNGWAVLHRHGDHAAGTFGSWRLGIKSTWTSAIGATVSPAKIADLRIKIDASVRAAEAKRRELHEMVSKRARLIVRASDPANPAHPYLRAKGIKPHGIRQRGDRLIIPLQDADGKLWTVQRIYGSGIRKRFFPNGRKQGCYFAIGGRVRYRLIIAEGFATAASVFEATNIPTFVAFDAGNLMPVAEALRKKYPLADIVIAADNDLGTEASNGINPGMVAALKAARSVNGRVALPHRGANA